MSQATEFNAIRIALASPDQIKQWSYGEVTKPETINYRTLRPEKDGLFCERLFGPTKDWECYCGKYKKIRFKGVICDRCGVEVTRAKVRRERMAHINLAAPVAHIWFAKGIPSRLGLLLDLAPRNLERVLYFAQYVVISIDPLAKQQAIEDFQKEQEDHITLLEEQAELDMAEASGASNSNGDGEAQQDSESLAQIRTKLDEAKLKYLEDCRAKLDDLETLRPLQLLTESRYRDLNERFGGVFKAGMGAEAILEILRGIQIEELVQALQIEIQTTSGQRRKKAVKRMRIVEALRRSGNKPEWLVLSVLPVLPPDLRPMVQLDGGRFATSDLNDLYRRVINRNNRLRRLLELGAPEIIVRNEKRMLQEAVDDLIDNGRRSRAIVGSHNHKLKSLSDLLRGKQGRFRQNLLGKRVDYGGRSVIVVGPKLMLHQCGLPKKMALELFKPFVMNKIVVQGLAHNIKSAKRMVERMRPEVWDILEEVIKGRPVLLNRAPTLHRLGIQAFMPILVEGSAIQLHPLVCTAFNADFDGDQMAVHVPLSREAVQEAKKSMLSVNNMLSPASGEPLVTPTHEIVLGCYYMTGVKEGAKGEGQKYRDLDDVMVAYDRGFIDLQAVVQVRPDEGLTEWKSVTPGRIIFNNVLPESIRRYDLVMDKKALKDMVINLHRTVGNADSAEVLDQIKTMGFHYASLSGTSIGMTDLNVPPEKAELIDVATRQVNALEDQFEQGLITDQEQHARTINVWQGVSGEMDKIIAKHLPEYGGIYLMTHSGARGNEAQIKQMAGMRGLMSNPKGEIIALPIKSSFREGLSVLEYFISTHGARKGLADTALRTADSGYLTRRLVDVAQEMIILEEDCGTDLGIVVHAAPSGEDIMIANLAERIAGRIASAPIVDPTTGEIFVDSNEEVTESLALQIENAGVTEVYLRSPQTCTATRGACIRCYGRSPATGRMALPGEAVGIIAAQSIGEPGTQLTMRTFHTGGVAGKDITSGLPRVEELFEARSPKGKSKLAEIDGDVLFFEGGSLKGTYKGDQIDPAITTPPTTTGSVLRLVNQIPFTQRYVLPEGYKRTVKQGSRVEIGTILASPLKSRKSKADSDTPELNDISARTHGMVLFGEGEIKIETVESEVRDHAIDATDHRTVNTGDRVLAGQKLTSGVEDPHDILRIEGVDATQRYLLEQVQTVYRNQGVSINDKHIEVITRQMLRWVRIENTGDTELLPNQLVDRFQFQEVNSRVMAAGGEPATSKPEILGVTRASLNTESFLAKASFQETARVLTEAAILGEVDYLRGLKENVIIGRLIPARLDVSEEGRALLGVKKPTPVAAGVSGAAQEADKLQEKPAEFNYENGIPDEGAGVIAELNQQEEAINLLDTIEELTDSTDGGEGDLLSDAIPLADALDNEETEGDGEEKL